MQNDFSWLTKNSSNAKLIRNIDWSGTSLGPVKNWPGSLRTAINLCLESKFPMYLWWGHDFINIYNDAYTPLAGLKKHEQFFGRPAKEMWAQSWDQLEGYVKKVFDQETTISAEDVLFKVERYGLVEDAYFTFSMSVLRDDQGSKRGIFSTCFETTSKVQLQEQGTNKTLKEFFEQAPAPMCILLGANHRFSLANRHYENLIGRKIQGMTVAEAFQSEDIAPFLKLLDSVYTTGVPFYGKEAYLSLKSSKGVMEDHWLNFSYSPFYNDNGEIKGILVFAVEITEQVLAREELKTEKLKFETIFKDSLTSMALLRGPELIFEKINPSYDRLFDNRIEIGKPILENLPELIDQPFAKLLQDVYSTGEIYKDSEARAFLRLSKDAPLEERYFDQTYSQVQNSKGEPYGVFIHAVDITEKVLARKKLEENEARMNFSLEAAHMGTWYIDLRTLEAVASKETNRIFGAERVQDNIFTIISQRMHPEDGPEVNRLWQEAVTNHAPYIQEYRILREDGAVRWVHSRGQATYAEDGTPLSLSGVMMDITDRKLFDQTLATVNKDLKKAVATRDEFLSIASHELKTPLTSMSLQTQAMRRNFQKGRKDAFSEEKVEKLILGNEKQISRLTRLVDDMLDIARIQSGKLSINRELLDLKDILQDVCAAFEEPFQELEGKTEIKLQENVRGHFDRARIEQVVVNLITNAFRYGRGKGLRITLTAKNNTALIQVTDQGIGISPENQEKIFNRFERLVSADEISGLGIGLYITKEIIIAHAGSIRVESEPGKGSTFLIELPLA
jgi:PAS domain S-box-containing protein